MIRSALEILTGALLCLVLVVWWLTTSHVGYADFDFATGLVRCGVDHLPASCASTQETGPRDAGRDPNSAHHLR